MIQKEQIEQWLREGTITEEQARKMLGDAVEYRTEQNSSKLITAISSIGSVLLGLGAILFVASNWEVIPDPIKVLMFAGSTFGACYIGYVLQYGRKNYPKVGAAILFLGTLLFGATIFLVAQIYNVNANSHALLLLWLLGILPFVYALRSPSIASLAVLLFYIWIPFFVFKGMDFNDIPEGNFFRLPVLYLLVSVFMFCFGALHYFYEPLKEVARIFRIAGIKLAMASLFLLTFRVFSGNITDWFGRDTLQTSSQFTMGVVLVAVLGIIAGFIALFFNPQKTKTVGLEYGISLGLIALALIFFFYPLPNDGYRLIFNAIVAGLVFVLLFIGYQREDMVVVNTGMFWLSAFVLVRYFDFFWDLLPRSLFFALGGLILLLGGIALEKKRRELRAHFEQSRVQAPPVS